MITADDVSAILETYGLALRKIWNQANNIGFSPAQIVAEQLNALIETRTPDPNQTELQLHFVPAGKGQGCRVIVESDERRCVQCGLRWGLSDETPSCAAEEGQLR